MKRWIWLAVAAVVLIAAGVTLVALPKTPEWTTSSPEALAEFEAGTAAQNKVYLPEAFEHYRRAYELDPDFVIAKWRYAGFLLDRDQEQAERLFEELATVDISGLNPRETFLIERWRANRDGRPDDAARIMAECLEKHPNDPYILNAKAGTAWFGGRLEEAERLYQRLLEISPNWVTAYNALGYISMMQGRFTESEEYFKSYRFIAPDQANPHDSLGELFITLGRYDEAAESLERAIQIKPDFWASYQHLTQARVFDHDIEGAREIIERARVANMPSDMLTGMECRTRYSELESRNAWQQILDERDSGCVSGLRHGYATILTHLAACRLDDWETAQALEDEAAGILISVEERGDERNAAAIRGIIHHMDGVRLAIQGDLDAAETRFRSTDDALTFMEAGTAMYKLYNRLILAETLLAGGKNAEAHQLLARVRGVNPGVARNFEDAGFRVLGLDRG
jgi:tetratricopeptide (TPR) repeat protein